MTLIEFKDLAGIITSILTSLSIIIGGGWVIYRFILQQERFPNNNFTTDINVIGKKDKYWIIELCAFIENKGKSQHRMKEFGFDLNAIFLNDKIETDERWGGQVNFPQEIVTGSYLPKQCKYFFIDPGTEAKYSYIAKVPESATFLILHSYFQYFRRKGYGHTAEKTIKLEQMDKDK
jgi:hypothetical protein